MATAPPPVSHRRSSNEPENAARLASEAQLIWVNPQAQSAPWLRELFPIPYDWSPDEHTWAFTTDAAGNVVREFRCSQRSLDAYSRCVIEGESYGPPPSCPVEAVLPCSIAPARPAIAAHDTIRAIAEWLGHP